MTLDPVSLMALFADYSGLLDAGRYDAWLALFATECRYTIMPRENHEQGLPAALIFCDSRAMLEDRIEALRDANKYNIHNDRHVVGLPRIVGERAGGGVDVEAPFAVYQSDQEGETRLFATGLYCIRVALDAHGTARIADALVLLDTAAVPTLLSTPL
ncbi:MAG TPA: aromatic-ring-hydroxylating dioxygenase subunit beta [Stellaceae bacterium]|nr:aromatic-ring-hydroxylating dioxygenase subunit beta [Stellaceae bacterium]